jgi:hypothetical protein
MSEESGFDLDRECKLDNVIVKSSKGKQCFQEFCNQLKCMYENQFWNFMSNSERNRKLRTYRLFKVCYEREKYLDLENVSHRKLLTKFRISAHNLYIERGRYKNIKCEHRICKLCNMNEVEDEYHFFMTCTYYTELRNSLLKPLMATHQYSILSFISLMKNETIVTQLALYLDKIYTKRTNKIQLYI